MRTSWQQIAAILALALAAPAAANPMATDGAIAVGVPGSQHVQVTYFCISGYGTCPEPAGLDRNGEALTVTWTKGSVSHNAGSGVTGHDAWQVCDCWLAPGYYAYLVKTPDSQMSKEWKVSATVAPLVGEDTSGPPDVAMADVPMSEVVVVVDAGASVDAGPTDVMMRETPPYDPGEDTSPETFPWEEPDPAWPQGLDCVAWCAAVAPPAETSAETSVPAELAADLALSDTATAQDAIAPDAGAVAETAAETAAGGDTAADGTIGAVGTTDGGTKCAAGALPGGPGVLLPLAFLLGLARRRRA